MIYMQKFIEKNFLTLDQRRQYFKLMEQICHFWRFIEDSYLYRIKQKIFILIFIKEQRMFGSIGDIKTPLFQPKLFVQPQPQTTQTQPTKRLPMQRIKRTRPYQPQLQKQEPIRKYNAHSTFPSRREHQQHEEEHISRVTVPSSGSPVSDNALIQELLFRMSRIEVKNYQLAAEVRMLKSQKNQCLKELGKRPSAEQFSQLKRQVAELKATVKGLSDSKPKEQPQSLFGAAFKKQPKYKFDSNSPQTADITQTLKYQNESLQKHEEKISKIEKIIQDYDTTFDLTSQRLDDIEECFMEQLDVYQSKKQAQEQGASGDANGLGVFGKLENTIFGQDASTSKVVNKSNYKYNENCEILFSENLTKFKKDDGDLFQTMRVNIEQNFDHSLAWLNIKTSETKIHKAAGILLKGKSEVKRFGDKTKNVMVSVFVTNNGTKLTRNVFKLQFEGSAATNQFVKIVEKFIK